MRRIAMCCIALTAFAACAGDSPPPTSAPDPASTPTPTPFTYATRAQRIEETVELDVGGRLITAEIADERPEISTGLMHRTALPDDAGMLFLLPLPQSRGFYMFQTRIPLSIAYMTRVDERTFEIVGLRDMEPCPHPGPKDCPSYPPEPVGTFYDATLEVNQGFFADAGVEVGDRITVSKVPGRE
jgi:hypothetical protein